MKVAINGLGRIGRAALEAILDTLQLEGVAINDIVLLRHKSFYAHGTNLVLRYFGTWINRAYC